MTTFAPRQPTATFTPPAKPVGARRPTPGAPALERAAPGVGGFDLSHTPGCTLQRKPLLGAADDAFEREADATAERILRMPVAAAERVVSANDSALVVASPAAIQRKCAACEDEEQYVQRKPTPQSDSAANDGVEIAVRAAVGVGAALAPDVRAYFEPRFGRDFSDVRIHADGESARAAQAVQARAYTLGSDIVFAAGAYAPETSSGRRLLAHELTHVVQQSGSTRGIAQRGPRSNPGAPRIQRAPPDAKQCDTLCLSLASMRRSVDGICRIDGEGGTSCKDYRARLATNEKRVADAGCKCAAAPEEKPPAPSCTTNFTKATSFQSLIDLIKAAEKRLAAAGITTVKEQIHALRGIYYGTAWSLDFAVEKSTTRNEGFQRFTRPSEDPAKSVPPDVRKALDCGLFQALQDSQDLVDPSGRQVDFGHLIIALDARGDPALTKNVQYPVATPLGGSINIDLGGTGTELVTWIGDLGGGAASLAVKRVAAPSTNVSSVFKGSDYGGSINLEGDVAGSVVATGSATAVTAPTFAAGKGLSDALSDYLSPAAASTSWNKRASTFLAMNGGTFDASGALTNRAALVTAFATKIEEFSCNYLASRVGDKKITIADAKAAADKHVVACSQEVAATFVDALIDSQKAGGKIEATRFPAPTSGKGGSCGMQLAAARFL